MNIKQLVTGTPSILRKCKRYNNAYCHHQENVAEHSFYTAFYTMVIARYLRSLGYEIDEGEAISAALLHDNDEFFSGDIVRPFKHLNEELNREIDSANKKLIRKFYGDFTSDDGYISRWELAKCTKFIYGQVVAFADYLSVLSYLYHEVYELRNRSLHTSIVNLDAYGKQFEYAPFIKPIRQMARQAIDQVSMVILRSVK